MALHPSCQRIARIILLNPPYVSYCIQNNIYSISCSTGHCMNWVLHIFPTHLKPFFSTFIILQTQWILFSPLSVKFKGLELFYVGPSSSRLSNSFMVRLLHPMEISTQISSEGSPLISQIHVLPFITSSILHYFVFLMTPLIIRNYFIYLFIYSLSYSFQECNAVRGGIK